MKLACQEQLVPGKDLLEKWAVASELGFDGLELRGGVGFTGRIPELRRARQAGVAMPAVCVEMDHFIGDFDPDRRRSAIEAMKGLLTGIAEAGGYGAITPAAYGMHSNRLPPFKAPRTPEEDRRVLIEGLGELGEHAAREGVLVILEPLNRYEDHMVNTLAQAVDLCRAVGLDSVRVMGDLYHMNIEEADLAQALRDAAPFLAHVHICDSNRHQPGRGHIDFRPVLRALDEVGYRGFFGLECRPLGEPRQVLAETVRFMRALRW